MAEKIDELAPKERKKQAEEVRRQKQQRRNVSSGFGLTKETPSPKSGVTDSPNSDEEVSSTVYSADGQLEKPTPLEEWFYKKFGLVPIPRRKKKTTVKMHRQADGSVKFSHMPGGVVNTKTAKWMVDNHKNASKRIDANGKETYAPFEINPNFPDVAHVVIAEECLRQKIEPLTKRKVDLNATRTQKDGSEVDLNYGAPGRKLSDVNGMQDKGRSPLRGAPSMKYSSLQDYINGETEALKKKKELRSREEEENKETAAEAEKKKNTPPGAAPTLTTKPGQQ